MRATLLAGLVALDAAAEAQAHATAAHAAQEAAEAHVIRLEAELDATRAATAEREAKGSRAARTAGARANDQMTALQNEAAQLRQELTDAKATLDATYQTLLELDETRVDELRCPRCGEFAPSEDWAYETADDGGRLIFHQPCGYHEKGLLDQSSILGYRHAD
jgi:hypothetical protein